MRFFSNEAKDNDERDADTRTDQDDADRVQSDPVAVPQQRAGSPWQHGPADGTDRPAVTEPAPQPTAFGASTVGGAVAASAAAGTHDTDSRSTDHTPDAASGIADDRTGTAYGDAADRTGTAYGDADDRTVPLGDRAEDHTEPLGDRTGDHVSETDRPGHADDAAVDLALDDKGTFDDPHVPGDDKTDKSDKFGEHRAEEDEVETRTDEAKLDEDRTDEDRLGDDKLGEDRTDDEVDGRREEFDGRGDELDGRRDEDKAGATDSDTSVGVVTPVAGTLATDTDKDNDGVPDRLEDGDKDNDGLTDKLEDSDKDSDKDNDGVADSAEDSLVETPAVVPVSGPAPFFPAADTTAMRERWRDVQLRFVDDPKGATAEAAGLVDEAVDKLTSALRDQRGSLAKGTEDTEALRVELRSYRDILDRLLGL